ncbi:MAG: TonB-dependent receptor [Flavobacteriaceae bacterium]
MKKITLVFYLLSGLLVSQLQAQVTEHQDSLANVKQEKIEKLSSTIEKEEVAVLKSKIKNIDALLKADEITASESQELKKEASELAAKNIKDRQEVALLLVDYAERNDISYEDIDDLKQMNDSVKVGAVRIIREKNKKGKVKSVEISISTSDDAAEKEEDKPKAQDRTFSKLVFAVGFNNTFNDGEFMEDPNYKFAASRYFEVGWQWSTRVFKETNFLRFRYGLAFQFNGLKPKDNQYFVENGDQTELEGFTVNLDKSKLRMDNLILPLHFELTNSTRKDTELPNFTKPSFKIGLGGFVGLNLHNKQKLKYKESGDHFKIKQRSDFNTNNFLYGLSAYIGWEGAQLYFQYNLNPVFKDNPVDENNFQIGMRFEI